jgi:hypothetical protein
METAKVDIRKLQLLNDRINQCIDALSQVRLSVHGLTNVANPAFGIGVGGYGQIPVGLSHTGSFGSPFISPGIGGLMNPAIQPAFGVNPFGQVPIGLNPFFQPVTPGLSHTAGAWAPTPFAQGFAQGVNPYTSFSPFGSEASEGYARTGATDPLLTARIAQTFPYAQFPAPPVISIY